MQVQSENVGITPGAIIASGEVDMTTFELFTKQNAAKKFQQKREFDLDGGAKISVTLKFSPVEAPKPAPEPEEPAKEEPESPQDEEEEKEEDEERAEEEEEENGDD